MLRRVIFVIQPGSDFNSPCLFDAQRVGFGRRSGHDVGLRGRSRR